VSDLVNGKADNVGLGVGVGPIGVSVGVAVGVFVGVGVGVLVGKIEVADGIKVGSRVSVGAAVTVGGATWGVKVGPNTGVDVYVGEGISAAMTGVGKSGSFVSVLPKSPVNPVFSRSDGDNKTAANPKMTMNARVKNIAVSTFDKNEPQPRRWFWFFLLILSPVGSKTINVK